VINKNKIVIYTSIFGSYDGLIPQPQFKGVDYICFTDQTFKSSKWKIIMVSSKISDTTRKSRHPKILPHLYLKDYKYSIYIDGNILVLRNPKILFNKILKNSPMGIYDHNQASDARDCVYKEHKAIIDIYNERGILKDDLVTIKNQITRYKKQNYPHENGLISATVLFREHHNQQVVKTMETWWNEIKNGSKRDQLSFNFSAWKNSFEPHIIDGDVRNNAYFYMLGKHRKSFFKKLITYRIKHLFGLIRHPKIHYD
jgi:hypothetical protein